MELKPCPFCGCVADFEEVTHFGLTKFTVGCSSDYCHGRQSLVTWDRRSEAMKAWNTRAGEEISHEHV